MKDPITKKLDAIKELEKLLPKNRDVRNYKKFLQKKIKSACSSFEIDG